MKKIKDNSYILSIKNISKIYRLYKRPTDRLKSLFFPSYKENCDTIVALQNITFCIKKGEHLGIIGDNGAGKSTLLKIISGVLTPSSGWVQISGRVLSILELGVGLHPEFTGRENIFFYGDILGFERKFINEKLEEIISFSELGKFIDRPVKTYSSGMLVRLAFSVVTSLEPDILILDEVLAVGDLHFQRKSLKRILDFRKKGITILFCSHDTYHIRMLCDKVIWLKDGTIEAFDDADKVIAEYESFQLKKERTHNRKIKVSNLEPIRIESATIKNSVPIKFGDDLILFIKTRPSQGNENLKYNVTVSLKLKDGRGVYVTGTNLNRNFKPLTGAKTIKIIYPSINLLGGIFYFHIRIWDEEGLLLYHELKTSFFHVKNRQSKELGIVHLKNEWNFF